MEHSNDPGGIHFGSSKCTEAMMGQIKGKNIICMASPKTWWELWSLSMMMTYSVSMKEIIPHYVVTKH